MTAVDKQHGRRAIVIAGPHRCGTSALARAVAMLGWRLPKNLLPGSKGNEAGHWEPRRIVQMNDRLLARLGRSWFDPKPLPPLWREAEIGRKALAQAQSMIAEEFGGDGDIVLKDPRMSRLGSLWIEALRAAGLAPVFIIACRNPLDACRSLMERDGFELGHATEIWLSHVLEAELASRSVARGIIHYEDLIADARPALDRMLAGLGLAPAWTTELAGEIESFISGDRRHFGSDSATFFNHSDIDPEAKRIYRRLLDHDALQDREFFDATRRHWSERWKRQSPGSGPSQFGLARAETFLQQSLAMIEDGRLADAVETASRAIAMAPGRAQYRAHLGALLARKGDLAGAEAALRGAIGLEPQRAGFHHSLGHILARAGRIEEAIAMQRRAIALDAGDRRYAAALDRLLARRQS